MKKLIVVMTLAVLGVMACKKKEEPAPEIKKYVYTRTPGEVTQIVGDIFVDTGGTVFTVKGKGFDPKRKKSYLLLLDWFASQQPKKILIDGYNVGDEYSDTASLVSISDSTIMFKVTNKNVYSVRNYANGQSMGKVKDTVLLSFAVVSKDSSNKPSITTRFDVLKEKRVRNKLFFNIIRDTLHWHTKTTKRDTVLTLDDIRAGGFYSDRVKLSFNDITLTTSQTSTGCYNEFGISYLGVGDGTLVFNMDSYGYNKDLGLKDGYYLIKMEDRKTGLPIEEKHGKKGVYVKFVD